MYAVLGSAAIGVCCGVALAHQALKKRKIEVAQRETQLAYSETAFYVRRANFDRLEVDLARRRSLLEQEEQAFENRLNIFPQNVLESTSISESEKWSPTGNNSTKICSICHNFLENPNFFTNGIHECPAIGGVVKQCGRNFVGETDDITDMKDVIRNCPMFNCSKSRAGK